MCGRNYHSVGLPLLLFFTFCHTCLHLLSIHLSVYIYFAKQMMVIYPVWTCFLKSKANLLLFHSSFFQVNKTLNQTFTGCLHTQSRSNITIPQHHTVDYSYYGFKTFTAKTGVSLLFTPHAYLTLYTLHNHSVRRAQGHDLYLNITAYEVLRLRNAQWYTVYQTAKCMSILQFMLQDGISVKDED